MRTLEDLKADPPSPAACEAMLAGGALDPRLARS
jgi:hypothetical protein